MNKQDVKILLLQLRNPAMRDHEYQSIIRSGKLDPAQITRVDGLKEELTEQHLEGKHLLIIGGSGDYPVFENLPFVPTLTKMLQKCREENMPVLGSCWGAQFMALKLDGEVKTSPEQEEVGTFEIEKMPETDKDPLFHDFPQTFLAQIGHHESITKVPPGALILFKSEKCPIHAFAWPGSTQYALQFHPELNKQGVTDRIIYYRDSYAADPEFFQKTLNAVKESPWTDDLVHKFIERIVVPRFS